MMADPGILCLILGFALGGLTIAFIRLRSEHQNLIEIYQVRDNEVCILISQLGGIRKRKVTEPDILRHINLHGYKKAKIG